MESRKQSLPKESKKQSFPKESRKQSFPMESRKQSFPMESRKQSLPMDIILPALKKIAAAGINSTEGSTTNSSIKKLANYAKMNLHDYLKALSEILNVPGMNEKIRNVSANQLRQVFTLDDRGNVLVLDQDWFSLGPRYRNLIKQHLLQALGTSPAGSTALPECIAIIACAELSHGQWPEVTSILAKNVVSNMDSENNIVFESLEAISCLCQIYWVDEDDFNRRETIINIECARDIFLAILGGLKNVRNECARLTALNALPHALDFVGPCMKNKIEGHTMMQLLCDLAQTGCIEIQLASLICLERVLKSFYNYVHHMDPIVVTILCEAIKSEEREISFYAVEMCDRLCQHQNRLGGGGFRFFVEDAMEQILPALFESFQKQVEEHANEEELNEDCFLHLLFCLSTFASYSPESSSVVNYTIDFLEANTNNPNWCVRYTSVKAFGAIMSEYVDTDQAVDRVLPTLIKLIKDGNLIVKNTACRTIGRVCRDMLESQVVIAYIEPFINALLPCLDAEPKIATNICKILSELSVTVCDFKTDKRKPQSYCLSKHFNMILQRLLKTMKRPDADEKLLAALNQVLQNLVKYCSTDCYDIIYNTTTSIAKELHSYKEKYRVGCFYIAHHLDSIRIVCGNLKCLLPYLTFAHANEISEKYMATLFFIVNHTKSDSEPLHTNMINVLTTFVQAMGASFSQHIDEIKPYITISLQQFEKLNIYLAALELMDQICLSIKRHVSYFCEDIVMILLTNLSRFKLDPTGKNKTLETLGNMAEASGTNFKKYLESVLVLLISLQTDFEDNYIEHNADVTNELISLHKSLLKAYTGIIKSLNDDREAVSYVKKTLKSSVVNIIQTLVYISESDQGDLCLETCLEQLRDLCDHFGSILCHILGTSSINKLLSKGGISKNVQTVILTKKVIKKIAKLTTAVTPGTKFEMED